MKNEEVTLILAGGNLSLPFLENVIKEYAGATIIAADRGLEAFMKLQIEPVYVIGDFYSLDEQVKDAFLADRRNVTKLNPIKDDTDSEAALHLAFEKTKGDIFLLGGTGTRLDHVLGNIAILGQGFVQDRHIFLLDEHNRIRLIQKECRINKGRTVWKICIRGFFLRRCKRCKRERRILSAGSCRSAAVYILRHQ